jgi:Zn-dependent peptidase ImmA (M78 family)
MPAIVIRESDLGAMPSVLAKATPAMLVWARETASMTVEEAARKIRADFDPERIRAWERGDGHPTLPQLRTLSIAYRRPLSAFFLNERPREFPIPRDFRGLGHPVLSRALRFELRAASERREVALELYEELEEAPKAFELSGELREATLVFAARARAALGVTVEEQARWRDPYEALRTWKAKLEGMGVLVFQAPGIPSAEMRGFSIYNRQLPIIAVNRGEAPSARIFSMMHELTHLMLREGGICNFDEDEARGQLEQRVEVFCNAVAAEILVPQADFLAQPTVAAHPARAREWEDGTISGLARRYRVSREVIVRRLLTFERATTNFYRRKREQYAAEFVREREAQNAVPERGSDKQVRILGNLFTKLVVDTYRSGGISLSEAVSYLGIKTRHLPEVERSLTAG